MYKVRTLDAETFRCECHRLEREVCKDFSPDLVVGIANGGVHVAAEMFDGVSHEQVKSQRPGTRKKEQKEWLFGILRRMPHFVSDVLRVVEAWRVSRSKPSAKLRSVTVPDEVSNYQRILVVDDACDTGHTLRDVMSAVRSKAPDAELQSAVITVTCYKPVIMPDYFLYHNQTLIRFPWSKDAKR